MTNILERIETSIISPMTEDGCWITSYKPRKRDNRAVIYHMGKTVMMARVVWEAHNCEPLPDDMLVLHSCDNPSCINPNHLFIGTPADNMTDMACKGRSIKGRRFGSSPNGSLRATTRKRDDKGRFI